MIGIGIILGTGICSCSEGVLFLAFSFISDTLASVMAVCYRSSGILILMGTGFSQ